MFIASNLAISIDGKIATQSREPFYLGTPKDRLQMQVLRKKTEAVLMGAGTLRAYRKFCGIRQAPAIHQPANIIVSNDLEGVSPSWPFFQDPELCRVLFVTRKLAKARLEKFQKSSIVIQLRSGKGAPAIALQIVRELEKRGFKKLLVEGGGGIMWDFVSQNLIDEYNVTLTPKVVGGTESPTLVDGPGFDASRVLSLKLARCRRVGDELFLVYRKI